MSNIAPPILLRYAGDGEFKTITLHRAREADKNFVIGEQYVMVEHRARSTATHNHYFAAVEEAFKNLPENLADQFPTSEHLRKWALIKAGFHNSNSLTFSSKAEAGKTAAFIRPLDEFGVVIVRGATVTHYTAKSQNHRSMDRDEFARSKEAVLGILSDLIGTSQKALEGNKPA